MSELLTRLIEYTRRDYIQAADWGAMGNDITGDVEAAIERIQQLETENVDLCDQIITLKRGIKPSGDFEVAFLESYLNHFRTLRKKAAEYESVDHQLVAYDEFLRNLKVSIAELTLLFNGNSRSPIDS